MSLATKQVAANVLAEATPVGGGLTVISRMSDWFETLTDKGANTLEVALTIESAPNPIGGFRLSIHLYESDDLVDWTYVAILPATCIWYPIPGGLVNAPGYYLATHPLGSPKKYFKIQFTLDESPATGSPTPYPNPATPGYTLTFAGSCWVSLWKA